MKTLYIKVTKDQYEFPVAVADTIEELARICGTTKNSIASNMSHAKASGRWSQYRKVEMEEDDER